MQATKLLRDAVLLLGLIGGLNGVALAAEKAADKGATKPAATAKAGDKAAEKAPAKAEPAVPAAAPDAAAAEKAIAAAEEAQKKAASVGGEWRDIDKMLAAAKDAVKAGDFAEAVKQANKARKQGETGYAQMMAQQEFHWPSYLKK